MKEKPDIRELERTALAIRRLILKTTHEAGCGHTGGSLSEADILTALFFRVMKGQIYFIERPCYTWILLHSS
jgi:transketolase N-terminal domain/subunit